MNHISLSNFPQRKLYEKQMSGSSGLFSFETVSSRSKVSEFLAQLQLFQTGISWGGYESMVYISSISKPYYRTAGEQDAIPVLIRLSIGLENWQDLWDDLQRALSYL
ncbi:PLP-dependent transferase [[Clostridium] innocuum]|nr:PLP-dependent transferase [[Clostridium] innocuum]